MNPHRHFSNLGFHIIAWWLAALLFLLVRYAGSVDQPYWSDLPLVYWWLPALLAILYGSANFMLDNVTEVGFLRRRAYILQIGFRVVGMWAAHLVSAKLIVAITLWYQQDTQNYTEALTSVLLTLNTVVVWIYIGVITALVGFIRQMTFMEGPQVLWNLMLGRYQHPQREKRIFMFVDMRDSTTHAERLGDQAFSHLIQDCFHDLTPALLAHDVEVYQYVGDEVILTWKPEQGLHSGNCVALFFDFRRTLEQRAEYYQTTYQLLPVFKAGVNIGEATVAEVGDIKRNIAFLSDVLNTAARIESMCNSLGHDLLISADLYHLLQDTNYKYIPMGKQKLKGKLETVDLYAVKELEEK